MAANDEARLIGSIADAVAYVSVQQGGDALLYAEAGPGWVAGSLFINRPIAIEWINPAHHHIDNLILRLWACTSETKKWRALTMIVGLDQFRTEFDFGESWSEDQDEGHRREAVVQHFFGQKLVIYPFLNGNGVTDEPVNSITFQNG